jgi:3D-(3,5/4)-trihydroxycyclohexane-1,2-dione acylhydrolase (decyclizing)
VRYSLAEEALADFAMRRGIPVAETIAGKASLSHDHPCAPGTVGVLGASAANHLAGKADVILAVGPKHSASLPGSESITPKIDLGPDGARTSVRRACEGEVTADTISSAF